MPRAVSVNCVVLVSPRYNATYSVLTSSMGEPAIEPLMSNKATIVADAPKGAVLGYVVSVR